MLSLHKTSDMQRLTLQDPKKINRKIDKFLNNDPESKFIFRLCSLKMFMNDPDCTADRLGKLMNTSPRTIANWIHKINEEGDVEVLRDKEKPGRTTRLDEDQLQTLQVNLQQAPRELGIDANLWDGKALSHHIKKAFGIELQVRQCQRLFRKLGFSLKRARTVVANANPKAKKAFKKTSGDS
jgi:transposase